MLDFDNPKIKYMLFLHTLEPNLANDLNHAIRYTSSSHLEMLGPYAYILNNIIGFSVMLKMNR